MKNRILILAVFALLSINLMAQNVTVREASGKVEFQNPGGSWSSVERGMDLPISATISTGFQSRAVLESDNATIIVQPLTRMTIDELQSSGADSQTRLNLRMGNISVNVKRNDANPSRFQVKSPIATAAVRGTSFTFNGYQLSVEEGTVAFNSPGGRVITVPIGGTTEMQESGVPVEVIESIVAEITVEVEQEVELDIEEIVAIVEIVESFEVEEEDSYFFVTVE